MSKKSQRNFYMSENGRENETRYLLFSLGNEIYGTPILGVREVLEPMPIKPVPNAVKFFSGVINVRGEIVGVIDLRIRFGHSPEDTPTKAFVVFDSAVGPIGAVVDKVEQVADIPEEDVERKPRIETDIRTDFLLGIAKFNERLISLVDFNRALGAEDLGHLRSTKLKDSPGESTT